jgi:GNAT superfamily N-acetyltransferase
MKIYQLRKVESPEDKWQFLNVVDQLYKHDNQWVRPLDNEIENVFNPLKNNRFNTGNACRWLLIDSSNHVCGRIGAFYDKFTSASQHQPTGGIGFFECINDQDGANLLFNQAIDWLKQHGLKAADGPVNFGNRDYFWGCLKEGFHQPIFNMPYNPPYYNDLFLRFGFKNFFNQYTYHLKLDPKLLNPILKLKAERLKRNPEFSFTNYNLKSGDRIANEFSEVFNKAWARFPGVEPIQPKQAKHLLAKLKPLVDERLIILAYYRKQPIGFFIMIPDINQIIGDFNGRLNFLNKLRLMYALKIQKKCQRVVGLIFGVIPEFQGKGIEAGLIMKFADNAQVRNFPYTDLEMNWIGDFNPIMMKLVELIGGKIYKTHVTYRYLFDPNQKFERAPIVNSHQ